MEASTSSDDQVSMIEDAVLVKESLDFSSPWHFSDVVLVVGDTNLHVHKCILSMWSPVFRTMFSSQFLESTAKEIPLPGKRADEMEVLLKFIYSSGTNPKVKEENYQFLLQLADEYQMDRVKSMCSEFLVNKIEASNSLEFFKLAEKFGLVDVTDKCYQEVRYNSSAGLEGSEHFNGFEPEFKIDICMRVIKELEKTLEEYVRTCSDLVQKVYERVCGVVRNTSNNLNHIIEHREQQSRLQKALDEAAKSKDEIKISPSRYIRMAFNFSCPYCIKRAQEIDWNNNTDSYSILKEPLGALYALQQNNEVARKAKKRADKSFKFGGPAKAFRFASVN